MRRIVKLALVCLSCAAMNAFAVAPGFYMGFMLGPATNNGTPQNVITIQTTTTAVPPPQNQVVTEIAGPTLAAKPQTKQFGTRFFLGYQMSKYVGFEMGLDYFNGIRYKVNLPPNTATVTYSTATNMQIRFRGFDLVVKGIMPLGNYFDVFGKIGPAFLYQSTSGALNGQPVFGTALVTVNGVPKTINTVTAIPKGKYTSKVRPTITIGASYDVSQNWVADISLNTIMVGDSVKNVSFLALGLSYHFVDKYCGQFLCDD